jgi:hypothetical protein
MSATARGTNPPTLDNFRYRSLLGTGGYADVYLYEQVRPSREVAVKVLLAEGLTDAGRRQFAAEADLMASLSAHPSIVTIYEADIAPDGRPYLVMEYYPGPNLRARCKSESLPVAEVLRIGVQVCSAVETAHRAGIIHRDIKPANILTSSYNKPGLTDFGISASTHDTRTDDLEGLSVPWSPPEAFDENLVLDVRSDIYSLGATMYTLLTGRSPFEVTGGGNSQLELMDRIDRAPVPPTGRPDVPPSLERLLAQCMAKAPEHRPRSALDLALSLQQIEAELHFAPTPIDIMGEGAPAPRQQDPDDDDRTRIRGPVTVLAHEGASADEGFVGTRRRPAGVGQQAAPAQATDNPSGRRPGRLMVGAAVVALLAGVGLVMVVSNGNAGDVVVESAVESVAEPMEPLAQELPPTPVDVQAVRERSGDITLSWRAPDALAGDSYIYWRTDSADGVAEATTQTSATVTGVPVDAEACFAVVLVRDGLSSAEPKEPACTGG